MHAYCIAGSCDAAVSHHPTSCKHGSNLLAHTYVCAFCGMGFWLMIVQPVCCIQFFSHATLVLCAWSWTVCISIGKQKREMLETPLLVQVRIINKWRSFPFLLALYCSCPLAYGQSNCSQTSFCHSRVSRATAGLPSTCIGQRSYFQIKRCEASVWPTVWHQQRCKGCFVGSRSKATSKHGQCRKAEAQQRRSIKASLQDTATGKERLSGDENNLKYDVSTSTGQSSKTNIIGSTGFGSTQASSSTRTAVCANKTNTITFEGRQQTFQASKGCTLAVLKAKARPELRHKSVAQPGQ